jgi:hypothetical protein
VSCVTGSVAVGTPRDGQDTTGRESITAPYLAQSADFTGNFANSPGSADPFFKTSNDAGAKDLRLWTLKLDSMSVCEEPKLRPAAALVLSSYGR